MDVEEIVAGVRSAKENGATRYCMGAAWRNPKPRDIDAIVEIVTAANGRVSAAVSNSQLFRQVWAFSYVTRIREAKLRVV